MKFLFENNTRKKLLTIYLAITFFFCAVLGKVAYIQLFQANTLTARAVEQWYRDLPLMPERGAIYDDEGTLLAGSDTRYVAYVRPRSVTDPVGVCRALNEVTGVDYDKLYRKVTADKPVSEITVAKGLVRSQMLTIVAMDLDGVYFSEDVHRYYPYSDFMTQLLGFVGSDGNGQEGLERYYDEYLFGTKGAVLTETDLVGRELEGSGTSYVPAIAGLNLNLGINYHVQSYAEAVTHDAIQRYDAKAATCIVMNAKTGAVLALSCAPSFDLNSPPRSDVVELMNGVKNHAVTDVYEPGSTFKIITLCASIEEGVAGENSRYYCPGYKIVDGQRIKCWKTQGHGSQTLAEAVKNSCNVAFMDMALALGTERMYSYISAFGFGEKTGIDVKGEAKSLVINKSSVKNVDLARIGFGHAIAVTPIALVRASVAAVNGGNLLKPYLCASISDDDGQLAYSARTESKRVISAETSKRVSALLAEVVSSGSGKNAYVAGYSIGGKTGTAQKYENGAIARGKYVSSFIGFAPAEDPEYVVYVSVDEPKGYLYYGSIVAAPYAGQVFSNIFAHFDVPASQTEENVTKFRMPDLVGKTYSEAVGVLRALDMEYEYEGDMGKITFQIPAPGVETDNYTVALIG